MIISFNYLYYTLLHYFSNFYVHYNLNSAAQEDMYFHFFINDNLPCLVHEKGPQLNNFMVIPGFNFRMVILIINKS